MTRTRANSRQLRRAVGSLGRPYRWDFLIGLLAIAAGNGFAVLIPLIFREGVDGIVREGVAPPLLLYGLAVIALTVCKGGAEYLSHQRLAGMGQRIAYDLRNRIFSHLQSLPISYFDKANTGDIMSRATSDVEGVRMFVAGGLHTILEIIFLFTASLGLMLSMSWQLTLIAFVMLPVLGYTVVKFRLRIRPRYLAVQEQNGQVATALQENLAGIRVIQAYRREQSESERFRGLNQELLERNMAAARERAIFLPLILWLGSSAVGVILWFGGRQVIVGRITLGEFVAFIGYVALLTRPLMILGWVISLAQRAIVSLARIEEVLSITPTLTSAQGDRSGSVPPMVHTPPDPILVFDRVDFAYNGRPVLKEINLQGRKGEVVAITGPSGAGKSTIAHLITRLYDVSAGKVMLNGLDVRELPLDVLRSHVAVVPQETFLFSVSVADNLAYGRPDVPARTIQRAAQETCLWESVHSFPQRLATLVGERGITLSGGQKQRVALARALLYGGEVLVLDDPFSNIDAETEEQLLATVRASARDRFVLLITHRIKTLQGADRIVVVVDGRIAEEGTHAHLLAQGGMYRKLYTRQCLRESLS